MSVNSKRKGKEGENEIVRLLKELFPYAASIEREWAAASRPGKSHDVTLNLNGYAIYAVEVKRVKDTFQHDAWWKQTVEQCPPNHYPLLIYRRDRGVWMVMFQALPTPSGQALKSLAVICPLTKWAAAMEPPKKVKGGKKTRKRRHKA